MVRFILRLVQPYWKFLLLVALAMVIETLMGIAEPWPLKIVLDSVISSHPLPGWLADVTGALWGTGQDAILYVAVAAIILIALLGGVSSYLDSYYTNSIGQWIAHDLRRKVYDHLQRLSLSYYSKHKIGDIISTITADIDAVQSFASSALLGILVDILTLVGMLGVMFYLNWDFTLIALSITPLMGIFLYRFRFIVKQASHEVRKKESEILSVVEEGLSAIRVVKAFAQGRYERERLAEKSLESVNAALKARRIKSLLAPFMNVVVSIGTALVVLYGVRLVLTGQMTAGSLIVFLAYLSRLFKPIQDLAKMSNTVAQAAVGLERVKAILDDDDRLPRTPGAKHIEHLNGEIEFRHVTFGYSADRPVLKDVSFKIEPGQWVGIVGSTGGGKSTIVSLIPRFYDPQSGEVRIDGINVRQYRIGSLRRQISFVLQETQLFNAPVWQNIAYGKPGAKREEIITAARLANAHEFIEKMENGYDTIVGERGATMSGGQRQRIGIARAIIRNTPILILDEPSSGLDVGSEKVVFEALERLTAEKTTLVITHRLATVRHADMILVVTDGELIEQGTHSQLLASNGFYAELWKLQDAEEKGAALAAKLVAAEGTG